MAIDSGIDFLLESPTLDADVVMLLGAVLTTLGRDDDLRRLAAINVSAQQGAGAIAREGTLSLAFREQMDLNHQHEDAGLVFADTHRSFKALERRDLEYLYWLVALSVNCERASPAELNRVHQLLQVYQTDYLLAHQLFAAEVMKRLGCISESRGNALTTRLSRSLAKETGRQPLVSDLDFERIAMLSFAGHAKVLSKTFKPMLLDAQKHDGSWGEDEVLVHHYGTQNVSKAHASALALFALVAMHVQTE